MDLSQFKDITPTGALIIGALALLFTLLFILRNREAISKLRAEMDAKIELSKVEGNRQIETAKIDLERIRSERERLQITIDDAADKRNNATMNRFAAAIEAATAATGQIAKAADATNRILTSIFEKQAEASDTHRRNSVLIGNIERDSKSGMDALSVKLDVQSATLVAANVETVRHIDEHTTRAIDAMLRTIMAELSPSGQDAKEAVAILKELRSTLGENGRAHKIDEIMTRVEKIQMALEDVSQHIKKHDTGPLPPIVIDPLAITIQPPKSSEMP